MNRPENTVLLPGKERHVHFIIPSNLAKLPQDQVELQDATDQIRRMNANVGAVLIKQTITLSTEPVYKNE